MATTPFAILLAFVYLFIASLALGLAFGLGTAFLLKLLHSHSTPQVGRPLSGRISFSWAAPFKEHAADARAPGGHVHACWAQDAHPACSLK